MNISELERLAESEPMPWGNADVSRDALLELVREQHEALAGIVESGEIPYCDSHHLVIEARAALAKYNDMMEKGDG